jgi:hypothetical protein
MAPACAASSAMNPQRRRGDRVEILQRKTIGRPTAEMGHERRIRADASAAGRPQTADAAGGQGGFRLGPQQPPALQKNDRVIRSNATPTAIGWPT